MKRLKWKFWAKDREAVLSETISRANILDGKDVSAKLSEAQKLDGITIRALGNKLAYAIAEAAEDARDPMTRRDNRYQTILLKEIALQLAYHNGMRINAEDRLRKAETVIYSQPLPDWS